MQGRFKKRRKAWKSPQIPAPFPCAQSRVLPCGLGRRERADTWGSNLWLSLGVREFRRRTEELSSFLFFWVGVLFFPEVLQNWAVIHSANLETLLYTLKALPSHYWNELTKRCPLWVWVFKAIWHHCYLLCYYFPCCLSSPNTVGVGRKKPSQIPSHTWIFLWEF